MTLPEQSDSEPPVPSVRCPCSVCGGSGCSECDRTGERVRTFIDAGDGVTLAVSGSAPLAADMQRALAEMAREAFKLMDERTGR